MPSYRSQLGGPPGPPAANQVFRINHSRVRFAVLFRPGDKPQFNKTPVRSSSSSKLPIEINHLPVRFDDLPSRLTRGCPENQKGILLR